MDNRLLKRQIKRYAGGLENIPEELMPLFDAIERSYNHYEDDRMLLERSMEISSDELIEKNEEIAGQSKNQKAVLDGLKSSLNTLLSLKSGVHEIQIEDDEDILEIVRILDNQAFKIKEVEEQLLLVQNFINLSLDSIQVAELTGEVVFMNNQAQNWIGKSAEEIHGLRLFDIDNKFPEGATWRELIKRLNGEEIRIERMQAANNGSSYFPVEISLKKIQVSQKEYVIAISRDISERKKDEAKRIELIEKLTFVNKELENFAHVVSHDLKAPLRGISSLGEWLIEDYGDKIDAKGQKQIRLLRTRVNRMHELIEGILKYSKAGRISEKMEEISVSKVVHEIWEDIGHTSRIQLIFENQLPEIIQEPIGIKQIFQNLISNAIKYHDKADGWVKLSCKTQSDKYEFCIADNGPGIDQKHFDKIFKIFQTLQSKDSFESTGIGLTIVKKIINKLNGQIWVESEIGKGSQFYFSLPRYETSHNIIAPLKHQH